MTPRRLVSSKPFEKSLRKYLARNPTLRGAIGKALLKLSENAFDPSLKTHKLSGNLFGFLACSCGYDCRIIFSLAPDKETGEEVILLIDIGTHEEVY